MTGRKVKVSLTEDTIEFDGVSYPVGSVFSSVENWLECAQEAGWKPPPKGGQKKASPLIVLP